MSKSPFVLEALNSPVKWWTWCNEALKEAKRLGKPILLDIGAVWCHWCHVMDEVTYSDPEVSSLINENFIPIKVDRDERPDIDRRYQEASIMISGQAGWPLTVFLTPSGDVIYAGTYFPPRDQGGLPGMVTVINAVLKAYKERSNDVVNYANQIKRALSTIPTRSEVNPDLSVIGIVLTRIVESYDHEHGGFGTAPKFPHVTYHSLLLYRGYYEDEAFIRVVERTLRRMGMGGIHDQLGGGFHRYSTDAEWLVPHFEKLTIDNAELLMNYAETYALTRDEYIREVGLGVVNFLEEMKNPEGGFYSSVDADVDVHDEGGYFRWSLDELRSILSDDEFRVVERYFGVYKFPRGEKVILHVADTVDNVAKSLGISQDRVKSLLESAVSKLREARARRRKPRIDTTIYPSWSSAAAIAYAESHSYLGVHTLEHSLRSVDFIMSKLYSGGLRRFYRDGHVGGSGLLEDYAYVLNASICAFEYTGDSRYLDFAVKIADDLGKFEAEDGGFYDRPDVEDHGLLSIKLKPMIDTPNWSPNALAIIGLDRLARVTGNGKYRDMAERAVKSLYPLALRFGVNSTSYFIALEWHYLEPPRVVIVGEPNDEVFMELWRVALTTFRPGKLVMPILDTSILDTSRDEALRYIVSEYRRSRETKAYLCAHTVCSMPVKDPESLSNLVRSFMRDKYSLIPT